MILLALGIRLVTFKFEYLLAVDPFHHYRIAEYIVEKGEFPFIWYLSQYPKGVFTFEPMGLYYTSVLFYKVFRLVDISFLSVFKLITPLFGVLTILITYFLTRHIFNKKVALYSAIILAFLPAFLYRTFAGFYRGDSLSIPFMIAGFFFFLLSINNETKKGIVLSILAGISLGFMSLLWDGYLYGFIILSAFVILYSIMTFLQGRDSKSLLLYYLISVGIGILILKYSVIVQPDRRFREDLIRYIFPSTIIFIGVLEVLKLKIRHINLARRAFVTLSFITLSLITIWRIDPNLISQLSTGYGGVITVYAFIGELQPPNLKILWQKYNIILLIFPLGLLYLLKDFYAEKSKEKLFLLTWFFLSIYLLINAMRYAFLASLPIAILSALFLYKLERDILPRNASQIGKMPQIITIIFLILVVFAGASFANEMAPIMSKEWQDALTELKNQDKGNVLSWVNYGSWVQGITGFPTLSDSVHGQFGNNIKIAGFFLETDESKTLNLLRRYHVDYVIVPADMVWQLPALVALLNTTGYEYTGYEYTLYPYKGTTQFRGQLTDIYGDEFYVMKAREGKNVLFKDSSVNFLPVKNIYYRENSVLVLQEYKNLSPPFVGGGVYVDEKYLIYISPKLIGTLLNSLMLLEGNGFDSYELIYSNSQIRIYKPVYNYIRIDELKTDKLYYKTGENISIHLKVKSTIPINRKLELKVLNPKDVPLFYDEYNATENTSLDISFTPPVDSVLGNYKIVAEMRGGIVLSGEQSNRTVDRWYRAGNGRDEVSLTGGLFDLGYRRIEVVPEQQVCLTSERIPIVEGENYSVTFQVKGIRGTSKSAYLVLIWGNWSIKGGNISKTITYIDDFSSKYKSYILAGTAPPGATQVILDIGVNCPAFTEIEPAETELYIDGAVDVDILERIFKLQD